MSTLPLTVQIYQEAYSRMRQHGLDDWTFNFSNEKRAVGRCYYNKKLIVYSKHFIDNTPYDEVIDTILHEIAHALAGPGHGHDSYWRSVAKSIGARPQRCASPDAKHNDSVKPNYIIECPKCLRRWKRFRLKKSIKTATHCGVPVVVYRVKHDN